MGVQFIGNRYRLHTMLARRGPVLTFLVEDARRGREVVLALADAGESATGLTAAATVVSAVAHPGFLPVLDVGAEGAHSYVVFEPPTETLSAALGRRPWGAPEVRRLGVDLAIALGVLHRNGLVHGSLHPGAVGLDAEGRALLALAPIAPPPPGWGGERTFTAAEQLAGAAPSAAGDVFSFGAVLLSALAGTGPGPLGPDAEIELATRLRDVGDPVLVGLIGAALARDAAERPGPMGEVASHLADDAVALGGRRAAGAPVVLGAALPVSPSLRASTARVRVLLVLAASLLLTLVLVRLPAELPHPSAGASPPCAAAGAPPGPACFSAAPLRRAPSAPAEWRRAGDRPRVAGVKTRGEPAALPRPRSQRARALPSAGLFGAARDSAPVAVAGELVAFEGLGLIEGREAHFAPTPGRPALRTAGATDGHAGRRVVGTPVLTAARPGFQPEVQRVPGPLPRRMGAGAARVEGAHAALTGTVASGTPARPFSGAGRQLATEAGSRPPGCASRLHPRCDRRGDGLGGRGEEGAAPGDVRGRGHGGSVTPWPPAWGRGARGPHGAPGARIG